MTTLTSFGRALLGLSCVSAMLFFYNILFGPTASFSLAMRSVFYGLTVFPLLGGSALALFPTASIGHGFYRLCAMLGLLAPLFFTAVALWSSLMNGYLGNSVLLKQFAVYFISLAVGFFIGRRFGKTLDTTSPFSH